MKIGLFTDSYFPSTNGIVYVVEVTRKHLEAMGHEVYIFCPAANLRKHPETDDHIIRFPAVKGIIAFDDYRTSLFFPPRTLKQIRDLKLDVIQFCTPGQIGLLAVYAAKKTHAVLVGQHNTDVYEYVNHYPLAVPAPFLLGIFIPFATHLSSEQKKRLASFYKPRRENPRKWSRDMIGALITMVYGACDATIALSRKSLKQLQMLADGALIDFRLLPTGVDALPVATKAEVAAFRKKWNIEPDDEVITWIGRLGEEKNLAMLIPTLEELRKTHPKAKLLYVGDFEYRETLEQLAQASSAADHIIFTGTIPRDKLGAAHAVSSVFVFPSMTDTQGWVLNEAAHAGLPIVLIDSEVTEVVIDGENGYIAKNNPVDFANKIAKILDDPALAKKFSVRSKQLAAELSERKQAEKTVELYKELLRRPAKTEPIDDPVDLFAEE